jgi:hypothetical protein
MSLTSIGIGIIAVWLLTIWRYIVLKDRVNKLEKKVNDLNNGLESGFLAGVIQKALDKIVFDRTH